MSAVCTRNNLKHFSNGRTLSSLASRPWRHDLRPSVRNYGPATLRIAASPRDVDKGLSLLEWTTKLVPQGAVVGGVKQAWRLAWQTMVKELAPQSKSGAYVRPAYTFMSSVGDPDFPVESGRYHVYVGNACPWCHRVLLALVVRGLLAHISVSYVEDAPEKATRGGWYFKSIDPIFGAKDLWGVYDAASPGFRGRCTAPLLVDKRSKRIVSNESSDIIRMLNDISLPGCTDVDLVPPQLRREMDALNDRVYDAVNNGVYKAGFSTSQAAYDEVQRHLFGTLDELDQRLSRQRFLMGDKFTEADLRLFPTVVRFDAVYSTIFRCTRRRISDYQFLTQWMRDVWQLTVPSSAMQVKDTVDVDACRRSYFTNLFPLNPSGIVPSGPTAEDLLLDAPVSRGPAGLQHVFFSRLDTRALSTSSAAT